MNITTKFNVGDMVLVKPGDRPAHLPEDENNHGKVIRIEVEVFETVSTINYILEFNDPDTGKPDPDWNELYEEDMLEEKV